MTKPYKRHPPAVYMKRALLDILNYRENGSLKFFYGYDRKTGIRFNATTIGIRYGLKLYFWWKQRWENQYRKNGDGL